MSIPSASWPSAAEGLWHRCVRQGLSGGDYWPEMRAEVSGWFISRAPEWDIWIECEGMGGMLGCAGGTDWVLNTKS